MTSTTNSSSSRTTAPWYPPTPDTNVPVLKLYNTLTRNKEIFVPATGRRVMWYNCGPTVYDAAHIGHARLYLSVDVMRRILEEYFNYDVNLIMNITDIDDKIILRARQSYLVEQFIQRHRTTQNGWTQIVKDEVLQYWRNHISRSFGDTAVEDWPTFYSKAKDIITGDIVVDYKHNLKLSQAANMWDAIHRHPVPSDTDTLESILNESRDILGPALDMTLGHTISDPAIFRDLAAYWENDFLNDMNTLGVRPPDILTRVSEYVPEIVTYVQTIINNGFAYAMNGSVYFDTRAFHNHPHHHYAKLEPWSANSEALIAEGEGDLSTKLNNHHKRSVADFALWKASKPGEPAWDSPWGRGRPGWHIECSVMASAIAGNHLDIHTGGEDLAFPHHDNELAQSEAHFSCKQWVNYFMHVGHLHVEGQKMSKSLKNFTTIKQALNQYKPSTLRMMYLQQHWIHTMDFKESAANEAINAETTLRNFATNIKAILMDIRCNPPKFTGDNDYRQGLETELLLHVQEAQVKVHASLCDNLNTANAMDGILDLVSKTNLYLRAITNKGLSPNSNLLIKVARYVTRMTKIFGLTDSGTDIGYGYDQITSSSNENGSSTINISKKEDIIMPYVQVMSQFRDEIRTLARNVSNNKDCTTTTTTISSNEILQICDTLRDIQLPNLGVLLDDRDEGRALIKLIDPDVLRKEREDKQLREQIKQTSKVNNQHKLLIKKLERLYRGRQHPKEIYIHNHIEYSQWDEQGIPTHDNNGIEITKSKRKKLIKEYDVQMKLHMEYLNHITDNGGNDIDWEPLRKEYLAQGKEDIQI